MADDLLKKLLAQLDLALPQRPLVGLALVPPKFPLVGDGRGNELYRQFGTDPAKASDKRTVKIFRQQALRELKKIKLTWPKLTYTTAPGILILHPSIPTIAPLNQSQLSRQAPHSSLSVARQRPLRSGLDSPVSAPLKVAPGASYGVLVARRREVYPQVPVNPASFPRLFG